MIIWLASYPKNGNTWLRALISTYLYSEENTFDFSNLNYIEQFPSKKYLIDFMKDFNDPTEVPKYWIPAQKKINLKKKIFFFKTHNALCTINGKSFTDQNNTLASLYVVRDPRNVITSLANHYGLNTDESYEFLTNSRKIIFGKEFNEVGQLIEEKGNVHFIGSWGEHYKSWKNMKFAKVQIIKYEDLIQDTENTFISVLKFLNSFIPIKIHKNKIKKVVEMCSFENLKKKEENEGFPEAAILNKQNKKITFFNQGIKNDWKKILKSPIEKKIRVKFFTEMKELGYL